MKKFGEEELIAYHLGELSRWRAMQVRRRLERDAALAAESEEIAATLRVFCCEPAPVVTEEQMERSWQRVRGSLGVLDAPAKSGKGWVWGTVSAGAVAAVLLAVLFVTHSAREVQVGGGLHTASNTAGAPQSWAQRLADELHTRKPAQKYNGRPGPLTTGPVDAVADDPALAAHLDTAERVLTEVSHTEGPLQEETREQVRQLMLTNAVYHHSAEQRGDLSTAAVIDDLGRVLTSLDAEPVHDDALRVHMNLGGVLLDLRILHHNDGKQ